MEVPETKAAFWEALLDNGAQPGNLQSAVLVVFGDPHTGKSQLITSLQRVGSLRKGIGDTDLYKGAHRLKGLDFAYINVLPPDTEDISWVVKSNVWILEDTHFMCLLNSVVVPDDLKSLVVVICVDLSEPWTLCEQLRSWFAVAYEFVTQLFDQLSLAEQQAMRNKFLHYMSLYQPDTETESVSPEGPSFPELTNLCVPFVICVTHSTEWEKLNTENFPGRHDVLLAHIRRICLRYRASIFYVSTLDNTACDNTQLLYSYCFNYLLDFPFSGKPTLEPPNAVFIPSGWDNSTKLTEFIQGTVATNFDVPIETLLPLCGSKSLTKETNRISVVSIDQFLEELLIKKPHLAAPDEPMTKKPMEKIVEDSKEPPEVTSRIAEDERVLESTEFRRTSRHEKDPRSSISRTYRSFQPKSNTSRSDTESLRNFFQMLLTKHPSGSSTARISKNASKYQPL